MGVLIHPRSPYYQLWLETAPRGQQREGTKIKIGTTVSQRRDSRRLAEDHYHQRMAELARRIHRLPQPRDAVLFKDYAQTYRTDVIPHHNGAEREREMLKPLVQYFGSDPLTAIDRPLVQRYMTERRAMKFGRKGQTVSASAVNREVDLLKSMLRDAVPRHLEASPLTGMKRLRTVKSPRRLLQPDEEERLLAVAKDPQDYALLVLGLDTLVRLGDLLDLRRIDRSGLWLMIRDPKMNHPYEVPLSPRAAAALDAITHDQPYYFAKFRRAENPRDWRGSVRQRFERLCAAADPPIPFGPGGFSFHGTRKTGATRMLIAEGVTVPVVQKIGNWSKPDVLLGIYTEAQRNDMLTAVGQATLKPRGRKSINANKS